MANMRSTELPFLLEAVKNHDKRAEFEILQRFALAQRSGDLSPELRDASLPLLARIISSGKFMKRPKWRGSRGEQIAFAYWWLRDQGWTAEKAMRAVGGQFFTSRADEASIKPTVFRDAKRHKLSAMRRIERAKAWKKVIDDLEALVEKSSLAGAVRRFEREQTEQRERFFDNLLRMAGEPER